jgi:fructose-1,6-bisphosphatase/inositol monophosphatase family enzyme
MTATGALAVPITDVTHGPDTTVLVVSHPALVLFHEVADEIGRLLGAATDWGASGQREGQYAIDVVTDAAAVPMLHAAGYAALSEESGRTAPASADVAGTVVIDPLDGSTNASRGVPWYATALCLVDADGPAVALVANQASEERFAAVRGEGAWRGRGRAAAPGGTPLRPSACRVPGDALVAISGIPTGDYGWAQFRAFGASALDLCLVGAGTVDGFVDMSPDAHGVWDYLAAALICAEAGAVVIDAGGRDLVALDHAARRTPVAAATPTLLEALMAARTER